MNISGLHHVQEKKEVTSKEIKGFWKIWRQTETRFGVAVILSCLFLAGCATPPGPTTAEPGTFPKRLGDGKEVAVLVEVENPSGDSQGINRNQIQHDIETKIRQAGVKVVAQAGPGSSSGVPILYVNVSLTRIERMYAYNADILWVNTSPRQPLAAKSGKNSMGTSGLAADLAQVRQKVTELVNLFIKDRLSVTKSSRFQVQSSQKA